MNTECTWIGSGERCCQPAVNLRSYCEDHVWRVYQRGTALGRRRKDIRTADNVHMWENLFNEAVEELIEEGEL